MARSARVHRASAQTNQYTGREGMHGKQELIPRIGVTERTIRPANAIASLQTMHMIRLKTDAYSLEDSKRRDTALSWPSEWPYLHPSQTIANETFPSQTAVRDESFVGATGTYNVQHNNHIAPPSQERHASTLRTGSRRTAVVGTPPCGPGYYTSLHPALWAPRADPTWSEIAQYAMAARQIVRSFDT